jgi:L-lactate dehydrogenase (cytochrome)
MLHRRRPPAGRSVPSGRERQGEVYSAGVFGRRPATPISWDALEARARRSMSRTAFAYIAGGAGRERTMSANQAGFDDWLLVPRVLRDVSKRTLETTLFGRTLPAPLLVGPVGVSSMAHPIGDLGAAQACADLGVPMVFSNQASVAMEDCAAQMGDAPRWFQLYWSTSDELVESFLHRAAACGCEAIVVTLDTTMLGWRPRDLDLASLPFARGWGLAQYLRDPVFMRLAWERAALPQAGETGRPTVAALRALLDISRSHPGRTLDNLRSPVPRAAVQLFLESYSRPSITWADLPWLRERTALPIVLKGVLHPDDARRALDAGVDGIVVSTHGGRQVDGSIGAAQALPDIASAVDGRLPVLVDSGVRTGADVLKALALGADAVLVGRPWVYGLAVGGADGVRDVLRNLIADLDLTLGLTGCTSVAEARDLALVRTGT